jgi:hypothetical protein
MGRALQMRALYFHQLSDGERPLAYMVRGRFGDGAVQTVLIDEPDYFCGSAGFTWILSLRECWTKDHKPSHLHHPEILNTLEVFGRYLWPIIYFADTHRPPEVLRFERWRGRCTGVGPWLDHPIVCLHEGDGALHRSDLFRALLKALDRGIRPWPGKQIIRP